MQVAGLLRAALLLLAGMAAGWAGAGLWPAEKSGDAVLPLATGKDAGAAAAPLDEATIQASLARLAPDRRQAVLDDAEAFAAFVERRGRQQVLAEAARAAGLPESPAIEAELRELTVELLAARYLEREAPAAAIAAPDEAAIESFYRDQQARFRIPDRLPVWQIFFAAPAADEPARTAARQRAREAVETLLAGRQTFAELAASSSDHAPSRVNGGFMGLLAPEEVKPEVRQALLNAPQGKSVGPIETPDGYHVVQRGALVVGSVPPLEEVRPRIEAWLREQALAAKQAEVLAAAARAHPLSVDAADLEAWRTQLRDAEAAEAAAAGIEK